MAAPGTVPVKLLRTGTSFQQNPFGVTITRTYSIQFIPGDPNAMPAVPDPTDADIIDQAVTGGTPIQLVATGGTIDSGLDSDGAGTALMIPLVTRVLIERQSSNRAIVRDTYSNSAVFSGQGADPVLTITGSSSEVVPHVLPIWYQIDDPTGSQFVPMPKTIDRFVHVRFITARFPSGTEGTQANAAANELGKVFSGGVLPFSMMLSDYKIRDLGLGVADPIEVTRIYRAKAPVRSYSVAEIPGLAVTIPALALMEEYKIGRNATTGVPTIGVFSASQLAAP